MKKPNLKKPELIVPAGNLKKLKIGLKYGADAFYLGLPVFSMRSADLNFTRETLKEGIKLIRDAEKKFYVTVNIYPRGNKIDAFVKHVEYLRDEVKPDGIILADLGVLRLVKKHYPKAKIHVSVQANTVNYQSALMWKELGAKRIILPRELSLAEIKKIRDNVKEVEFEFFVHGAICVSYSGRCLLSMYMTGRDANQGICAHSCRWKYKLHNQFVLEEEKRPFEFMPIEEDEHGTYILNSKDMCLLPYLKDLIEAGISSFKVEGRNKTEYYLATVTKAYRKAIDDMMEGKDFDDSLFDEVKKSANRGFIPGFLKGFPTNDNINYEKNTPNQTHVFVGMITQCDVFGGDDLYRVDVRNRLESGEKVEVVGEKFCKEYTVTDIFDLNKNICDAVHGGGGDRVFKLKKGLEVNYFIRKKKDL